MTKKIFTIVALIFALAVPFSNAEKKHTAKEDMKLASVSKTNPFEIVPAAGMELLGNIDDQADAAMVDDLLKYAHKFMGTPYRLGSNGPKSFDCSGFTSYVFRQFGVKLTRTSASQFNEGKKVNKNEVQPGDLLFFTGRANRPGRIGHVAIAIDQNPVTGEITFIHAATGGVQISKSTHPYYAKRFVGARRVVGI